MFLEKQNDTIDLPPILCIGLQIKGVQRWKQHD